MWAQIFFFFLGLAIMLISVMTSSQEAASFRLNSGSASDGDLPYRWSAIPRFCVYAC